MFSLGFGPLGERAVSQPRSALLMARKKIAGSISEKDAYTLRELKQRLGLSMWSMWRARRHGLKVRRMGRREFVLGRDFMTYLEKKH